MKKVFAFLLAVALLCAVAPISAMVSAGGNMLVNGDFETGDSSGWTVPGWCSNTVIVSEEYGYDGSYGVGLTTKWVGLYQVLNVKANTDYAIRFWVKGYAVVYFKDGNENTIAEHWPQNYSDWTEVTYEVNTGSSTTLLVELNAGSQTAMVDNVVLTTLGEDDDDNHYNDGELEWPETGDIDPADVHSVEIETAPNRTDYYCGEELDTTGLTLRVNYGDEQVLVVSSGFTVSGYNPNKVGTQTVTVTLLEKTATFTVTVKEALTITTFAIAGVMDKIKTQGRNLLKNGALMLDFSASGIEFGAQCEGTVTVTFDVKKLATTDTTLGGVYFTVVVDGVAMARDAYHLATTGQHTVTIATGLDKGDHTFAIYRQTEHAEAEVGITSIALSGTLLDKPEENKLYIEFVGDSISVGQCNLAKQGTANAGKPLYQDATQAYPFLTAQLLDADYSNVSWSGAGCKYGYAGLNMQDVYPKQRYNYDKSTDYDFSVRQPDIVVFALGTNDGMNQKDAALLKAGMLEMLNMVRKNNPFAQIVWIYNMMTDTVNSQVEAIVEELGGAEEGYYCVKLTRNTAGGSGHPNVEGHQVLAQELATFIEENVPYPVKKPVGVTLVNGPDKTEYEIGESLDTTGLVLEVEYDDGSKESITEGYTYSGYQSIFPGTRTVKVTYRGFTVEFTVEVLDDTPVDPDPPVDPPAPAKNGWVEENGKWAYYVEDVKVTNKWMKDSVGWCYLGADGYCETSTWKRDSIGWCYLDDMGRMVYNKWINVDGKWYHMNADGYMDADKWVADSKGWCYVGGNGAMVTNKWVKDSVGWCYVGADGYCVTNKWVADSKGWCYLDAQGRMVTNKWVKDSVGWCYIGEEGYCLTNTWQKDSKGWCYLDANGRMVYNTTIDGYYINADGYWVG